VTLAREDRLTFSFGNRDKISPGSGNKEADLQQINQRLDLLDRRLDNIDSTISAVAERVMSQAMVINITCPHCGKNMEIALIGNKKPSL
jgi:hypothetical protein